MKSHPVPKVGDTVVLNDSGLGSIYGTAMGLSYMKTLEMKIIGIAKTSITYPELTFPVEVDNRDIDSFMIDHWHFDIVKHADAPTPIPHNSIIETTNEGE